MRSMWGCRATVQCSLPFVWWMRESIANVLPTIVMTDTPPNKDDHPILCELLFGLASLEIPDFPLSHKNARKCTGPHINRSASIPLARSQPRNNRELLTKLS